MVCQILNHYPDLSILLFHVKHEVQTNIADVDRVNQSKGFKPINIIEVQLRKVKIFTLYHVKADDGVSEERLPAVTSL